MSNGNENLRNALRVLSAETRGASAAPRVKASLLNEMRRRHRKALALKWWPAVALAMAALVMGVWLGVPKAGMPVVSRDSSVPTKVVAAPPPMTAVVEAAAVPVSPAPAVRTIPSARPAKWTAPAPARQLSPLTPWYVHPGLPQARQGHVVYMEVGAETARLFGLTSTGPLQAEVFLGDDGLARAIRLVRTTEIARGE